MDPTILFELVQSLIATGALGVAVAAYHRSRRADPDAPDAPLEELPLPEPVLHERQPAAAPVAAPTSTVFRPVVSPRKMPRARPASPPPPPVCACGVPGKKCELSCGR